MDSATGHENCGSYMKYVCMKQKELGTTLSKV